jgi:hypothetical protein
MTDRQFQIENFHAFTGVANVAFFQMEDDKLVAFASAALELPVTAGGFADWETVHTFIAAKFPHAEADRRLALAERHEAQHLIKHIGRMHHA